MNAVQTPATEDEHKPGAGPPPRALTDKELSRLLREQQLY